MRPRGFIESWNPRNATVALIDAVGSVLTEYHDYLPLTIRQIFYRLVVCAVVGKTEADYERLCEHLNRARRARIIPFDAIRDDGFTFWEPSAYRDQDHFWSDIARQAEQFTLDRLEPQRTHLMVWCEAQGMLPQLENVARPFGVSVASSGGFDSVTAKHDLAGHLAQIGKPVTVLHVGDHDPSGVHIFSSLAEDIAAFAGAYTDELIEFVRLAVTPEQVDRYKLPTAPPKKNDRRSFAGLTTQAEALPPDLLADIVRDAITSRLDMSLYWKTLREEAAIRDELTESMA